MHQALYYVDKTSTKSFKTILHILLDCSRGEKIRNGVVENTVVSLLKEAVTSLPRDVLSALKYAEASETNEIAKMQLRTILKNIGTAENIALPMCQDTGIHIFFVTGKILPDIEEEIRSGTERATKEIPLRPNAVHPLSRENPGTNVADGIPYVIYHPKAVDYTEITVLPKGAGSENMSALAMLTPSQGLSGIKKFILDTVVNAAGKPCPPVILGIGIGGTADEAMAISKKALLRPLGERNQDPLVSKLETDLQNALNMTGIGPMGLGGDTTVLGVNVEIAYCHTASLPVAVNMQCWAARRATARIYPDGSVKYITKGANL